MLIKLKCLLNWNVTQIGKWKVTHIGMSLKSERHINWNATQIEMSLKINVINVKVSLYLECHLI